MENSEVGAEIPSLTELQVTLMTYLGTRSDYIVVEKHGVNKKQIEESNAAVNGLIALGLLVDASGPEQTLTRLMLPTEAGRLLFSPDKYLSKKVQ